jgi:hypothetical protein
MEQPEKSQEDEIIVTKMRALQIVYLKVFISAFLGTDFKSVPFKNPPV